MVARVVSEHKPGDESYPLGIVGNVALSCGRSPRLRTDPPLGGVCIRLQVMPLGIEWERATPAVSYHANETHRRLSQLETLASARRLHTSRAAVGQTVQTTPASG